MPIQLRIGFACLYSLLAFVFVALSAVMTPPFQVPDEFQHYFYARAVARGVILPSNLPGGGVGAHLNGADLQILLVFNSVATQPQVKVTGAMIEKARAAASKDFFPANFWGAAVYAPVAYAVPGLALKIADWFGADRLTAFYAGRIGNGILFVLLSGLALALAPAGHAVLATILLLPMTLSQAGSFSADALVLGLTPLVCVLLLREGVRDAPPRLASLWMMTVAIIVLSLTKPPLVALLAPLAALAWRRSATISVVLTAIGVLCFVGWTLGFVLTPQTAARSLAYRGADVSSSAQFAHLLSSPLSIPTIAVDTLAAKGWFYVMSAIGIFGWLEVYMPARLYLFALGALALTAMANLVRSPGKVGAGLRWSFACAAAMATAMTFLSLYLVWTAVGATVVEGVQGRYLLPIIVIIMLAVAGMITTRHAVAINSFAFGVPILMWVVTVPVFVDRLIARYYLH